MPACIRLRLLGRPVLTCGADPTPVRLSTRKVTALVGYLATSPDQSASREELATLLWGSCSDQQARQSLRQALVFLRKDLASPDYFAADSTIVRLRPGLWSVDALEFEALSKSSDPDHLARAAALFCGDFLAGLNIEEDGYAEWLRAQRARTEAAAARLCETFAGRPELVIDPERAVTAADRLLALDPLREDWQRPALTLYARYRGKSAALAKYDGLSRLLRQELDVAPERETDELATRIRGGEIAPAVAPRPERAPPGDLNAPEQIDSAAPRVPWRSYVAAAAALALLVTAGIFALAHHGVAPERVAQPPPAAVDAWRPPAARSAQGIVPIAVLPFAALGDTAAPMQLVADMMTDDLINILSRVPVFRVISRQTTNRYKGQPIDLAAIGTELQVRYVLEGSVKVQDGILRVNLQLLEPATQLPVWTGRIEREQGDRYAVRDEIVARIARELQIDILPIEGERRSADQSADAAAFRGWAAMQAAYLTTNIDNYRKAEALFKEALARDPQHLAAFIGLGSFHTNIAVQRLTPDSEAHFSKAREILTQAVQREPRNPNALFQLGILLQGTRQIREALDLFQRVTELNPSNAGAHAHTGHALARLGEPEKGIEHIRYAMRLSPKDSAHAIWHEFIGNAQLELSRYSDAVESFEKSAALAPRYPRPWAGLAAAHALAGDTTSAKAAIGKLKAAASDVPSGDLLGRLGRNPRSRLYAGLRLALAPAPDAWRSPPLPSEGQGTAAPSRGLTAIAVLPLTTHAGSASAVQSIADTLTDDLTNTLSRVPNLRVISRQTTARYQERQIDIAAIGAELQVRYVLEGTVRMNGDMLRVNAELIDPTTRLPAWSAQIDRADAERHTVQDEIVARLGRELHFEVLKADSERASSNPDIFDLSRVGWKAIFDHAIEGMAALTRAKGAFSQILERDPQHWGARGGMGAYHVLVGSLRLAPDWSGHLDKGEQILGEAIRERPNEPSPYFYFSIIQRMGGRIPEAIKSLERCIAITPSAASCYAHIGHALVQLGRAGEGLEHINYALRLSPHDATRSHWLRFAGDAEIELGNYAAAVVVLRQSYAANQRQPLTLRSLAAALALAGKIEDAQKIFAELKALAPQSAERAGERRPPFDAMQPELNRGLRLTVEART